MDETAHKHFESTGELEGRRPPVTWRWAELRISCAELTLSYLPEKERLNMMLPACLNQTLPRLPVVLIAALGLSAGALETEVANVQTCTPLAPSGLAVATPPALVVDSCRTVAPGTYTYGYVNITAGGTLRFLDPPGNSTPTDFYARSILVEQGGTLQAGTYDEPFGSHGGHLTLGLWGSGPTAANLADAKRAGQMVSTLWNPPYAAIECVAAAGCYPSSREGKYCDAEQSATDPCQSSSGNANAQFQGYDSAGGQSLKLPYDNTNFGYKVLAVSYGGSLKLFGKKGVRAADRVDPDNAAGDANACVVPAGADEYDVQKWADGTGNSWARLDGDADASTLELDRDVVDWAAGDHLVVATTDWYPSHSELVRVAGYDAGSRTLTLSSPLQFPHAGGTYPIDGTTLSYDPGNPNTEIDVRGAVGLLSRSITVRSMGDFNPTTGQPDPFAAAASCGCTSATSCIDQPDCYFGGHVIARQGFAAFQVQGVEFRQLGQGGRMAHYPVHFHIAKDTSYTNAFVKDSSIWDSNTRFVVVHASHDVEVSRNVGYLSMGHGYYIEDGSEINNLFCYNLGVGARAAFKEYFAAQPSSHPAYRYVPPILNEIDDFGNGNPEVGSDAMFPSMFWIMNASNDFVGNKAVGLHGTGVCYWPLSSSVSGISQALSWDDTTYADYNQAGAYQAPLLRFRGNSCSTAAYAIMTERSSVPPPNRGAISGGLTVVDNPYLVETGMEPTITSNFMAMTVPGGCTLTDNPLNATACATTIVDHFTTSFNWAQVNLGSVWFRPFHYVFSNGAITDQLYGGLSFISGGSPEQVLPQRLTIAKDSLFIGGTQPFSSRYASPLGPDYYSTTPATTGTYLGSYMTFATEGVPYYLGGFNPQRLMTIYDGPFFADGNIFDAVDFHCDTVTSSSDQGCGFYKGGNEPYVAQSAAGKPLGGLRTSVINAGIGWKQPNGFYYPPAFAFKETGFVKGSTRHNVFDVYQQYAQQAAPDGSAPHALLSGSPDDLYPGVTPIDFTTILNDLDGTLNGVKPRTGNVRSSGLSNNHFYASPYQVAECNSFGTQTMPHEFVSTGIALLRDLPTASLPTTTVVGWPDVGAKPAIPVYRQYKLPGAAETCATTSEVCASSTGYGCRRSTLFMSAEIGQAIGLTVRNGIYYIDASKQDAQCATTQYQTTALQGGSTYAVYHLFANDETRVTYQIYVGDGFSTADQFSWLRVHPHDTGSDSYTVTAEVGIAPPNVSDPAIYSNGVLSVAIDNSQIESDFGYQKSDAARCQPLDVCQPDDAAERCSLSNTYACDPADPERHCMCDVTNPGLTCQIQEICEEWVTPVNVQTAEGVYLDDCPRDGCLGFAVKMPVAYTPPS